MGKYNRTGARGRADKYAVDSESEQEDLPMTHEDMVLFQEESAGFLNSMNLPEPEQYLSRSTKRKRERQEWRAKMEEASGVTFEHQPRAAKAEWAPKPQDVKLPIKVNSQLQAPPKRPTVSFNESTEEQPEATELSQPLSNRERKLRRKNQLQAKVQAEAGGASASKTGTGSSGEGAGPGSSSAAPAMGGAGADRAAKEASVPDADAEWANLSPQERLEKHKQNIAVACSEVMENPDANIKQLATVLQLCSIKDQDIAPAVGKLAIMSLATVFKDIIPAYRIRAEPEPKPGAQLAKETKKLQAFERTLLATYQRYLQHLHKVITRWRATASKKGAVRPDGGLSREARLESSLAIVSTRCLCSLLEAAPHFNFRSNIVDSIVPFMKGDFGAELCRLCCGCISTVFKNDKSYDVSVEIVRTMSREIKACGYKVSQEMIICLRSLKIQEYHIKSKQKMEEKSARKKGKHAGTGHVTRRGKREGAAAKELERELREAEATVNKEVLTRNHTEILKQIFTIYFRVLKFATKSPLLSVVLEGLSAFAHLIDASFFGDLMKVLDGIVREASQTTYSRLHSVKSASIILAGQAGSALTLDPKAFHDVLYALLLDLKTPREIELALSCVQKMFSDRREVSLDRIAAFIKRLVAVSVHMEQHYQLEVLRTVHGLQGKYPRLARLLDAEVLSTGAYRPNAREPELTNPFAATSWEASIGLRHFHPFVQLHTGHMARSAPAIGDGALPVLHARTAPDKLRRACDPGEGLFNPPLTAPRNHPLAGGRVKRKRVDGYIKRTHLTAELAALLDTAKRNAGSCPRFHALLDLTAVASEKARWAAALAAHSREQAAKRASKPTASKKRLHGRRPGKGAFSVRNTGKTSVAR